MLNNTATNRKAIHKIALALGEMNDQVIYVGGATLSLYINDPAADDVRSTKDVDISLAIASFAELEAIRKELTRKGFKQSVEDDIICRFRYEDVKVDVMSTKAVGWAPANPWFAPGFVQKETIEIEDQKIHILPLPYFLASKFAAFNDRGAKDPRLSHDFEDIVFLLDNRTDIVEQLAKAPDDVMPYLAGQFERLLDDSVMQEATLGNLIYETREERFQRIIACIKQIVNVI
ncbi:MAG: nucleotidyl transferase AbiEii/AbiGii toxin family protein [Bacteroidales bacterium]